MLCTACGFENPCGGKFCGECGAPLRLKCTSCGSENAAGFKFCGECGKRLLEPGKPAAPPDPRSYTPKHLAEKILRSRSALQGERKQVTVLFTDVKGSMDLAESIGAEEWHRIMNRVFKISTDGIHRFEGTVNQYTGDGIMALFGAPIAHEDHAKRACYAALSLQDDLRRYAKELRAEKGIDFALRMGLHSGEVVVGKIGDDLRMDYTALGHTASLGARMEQIAEPGTTYLSEHTAKLVEGMFALKSVERMAVKGVKQPLKVYQLIGVGPLRTKLEMSRARGFSRFVGRDREMGVLQSAFDKALEGRGQIVGIVGEAGVGKSRLCLEFVERCRAKGVSVNEGHCLSHGRAIPYLPVLEVWRSYFGITEGDSGAEARRRIAATLEHLGEDFIDVLPLVFEFLGVADPEQLAPPMEPERKQRQMVQFVRRVVRLQSARAPFVVVIDDLHWIDRASDQVVEQFADAIEDARAMFLVNFRPEYEAPWIKRSHYEQLPLLPLGAEGIEAMLEDLLGSDSSVQELKSRIRERTGGNPFFMEEIVQSLTESGALEGERGSLRMARALNAVSIPPTVEVILAARIDRLPDREKELLQTASVIGRKFPEAVLKNVAGVTENEFVASLAVLGRGEFVRQESLYPEVEWTFKHPLTQEAAYRSQLSERRKKIHAAVAQAIYDSYPDKLGERASELAHHWEQAGEPLEAARWHQRAARWGWRSHVMEAVQHLRKVRELAQRAPDSPEAAELNLRACLSLLGHAGASGLAEEEARVLYSTGKALATRKGDLRAVARLSSAYSSFLARCGLPEESLRYGEEAVALAECLEDPLLKLASSAGLLHASLLSGRLQRGLSIAEEGLEVAEEQHEPMQRPGNVSSFRALMCFWKGTFLSYLGRPREAESWLSRAIALAQETGDLSMLAFAHSEAASVYGWSLGDIGAMLTHARQGVQAAERLEAPALLALVYNRLGHALRFSGVYGEALAAFERALAVRGGFEYGPFILTGIAWTHLSLGNAETALSTAREAANLTRRWPSKLAEFFTQLCVADILLSTRGVAAREEVEAALQRAAETAAEMGAKAFEPDVLIQRARLSRLLGEEDRHRGQFSEAHRLLTNMGATARAARLKRELSLSPGRTMMTG